MASSSALVWMPRSCGVPSRYACLAATSASPTATGPGAGAQGRREARVQPLAVLQEVRVAVLVAGAGDERGAARGERLHPVERLRHARHAVVVDDRVAGVAARAEDDRVREVDVRRRELRRVHGRRVVGRERVVGAEVAGQEDQVVAAAQQLGAQLARRSRTPSAASPVVDGGTPWFGDQLVVRRARAEAGDELARAPRCPASARKS